MDLILGLLLVLLGAGLLMLGMKLAGNNKKRKQVVAIVVVIAVLLVGVKLIYDGKDDSYLNHELTDLNMLEEAFLELDMDYGMDEVIAYLDDQGIIAVYNHGQNYNKEECYIEIKDNSLIVSSKEVPETWLSIYFDDNDNIYRIIYEHNVGQEYGDSKNTMFEVQGTYEVVTRGDNMNFAGYYSSEKYSQDDFHIEFDTRIEAMKYYKYKVDKR